MPPDPDEFNDYQPPPLPEETLARRIQLYCIRAPLIALLVVGVGSLSATGCVALVKLSFKAIRWLVMSW